MMHNNRYWHDLGEDYGTTPMIHFAGLLTYRHTKLFCRGEFSKLATIEELSQFEKDHCYINNFIINENLEKDFVNAVEGSNVQLTSRQKETMFSSNKTNTSSRNQKTLFYYYKESIDLVAKRKQFFINKFNYSVPIL